jgi:hypothetical protein
LPLFNNWISVLHIHKKTIYKGMHDIEYNNNDDDDDDEKSASEL